MDSDTGRMLSLFILLGVMMIGCTGVRPKNLGVRDNLLAPCPSTPNCVSSQSTDREHAIEPLPFTDTVAASLAKLKKIVLGMKRSRIITETGTYIHVEFTSAVFRFVDDTEFLIDENAKVIHVRSAARLGSSDIGVNRKRVEELRKRWTASKK